MRNPSRPARVFTIALAIAASGCVGPFARGPSVASAPAAPPPDARDASTAGARPIAPGEGDCDDGASVTSDDDGPDAEHTTLDDGFEPPTQAPATPSGAPLPFAELTDAEIAARLADDIGALGPMAVGRTNGGALVAGVRMPDGANWEVVHPTLAWGTRETVDALARAIDAVAARFPETPKLFIGDISAKPGGHLHPHVSHQSGRDVDLGYYLTDGRRWYANARGSNLDRARTWHLIRTFLTESDVELILVDRQIQRVLKDYALAIGEDPAWLDEIFQVGGKSVRPLIMHAKGHATHLHVRFYNPVAQELGRRAYRTLIARRVLAPPTLYVTHTVKPGETLSHLALRYKVTTDAIKKANALSKDIVKLNKPYKIPRTGGIAMPAPIAIPARRIPPPVKVAANERPVRGGIPCGRLSAR